MSVRFLYFCLRVSYAAVGFGTVAVKAADNTGNHKSKDTWTLRVITEKELEWVFQKDRDLSPSISMRILAKLNARDFDYIAQDIRDGTPIKVPNDFTAFKTWTPLERFIPDVADLPEIHTHCQRFTLYRLVRKRQACWGHVYLRRESGWHDQGGPLYGKGKGYKPRIQELSKCMGAACADALGFEGLRYRLDTRRGHSERTLFARVHQPADLSGGETVRLGDPGDTDSYRELAGKRTVGFSAKPLQLYSARIGVQCGGRAASGS